MYLLIHYIHLFFFNLYIYLFIIIIIIIILYIYIYMIYDCVWRCITYLKSLWNTSTSYMSSRHSCAGSLWRAVLHAMKSFLGSPNLPVWGSPWVTPWRSMEAQHSVGAAAWSKGPKATKDWRPDQWQAPSSVGHFWNPHLGPEHAASKRPCANGIYQKKEIKKKHRDHHAKKQTYGEVAGLRYARQSANHHPFSSAASTKSCRGR